MSESFIESIRQLGGSSDLTFVPHYGIISAGKTPTYDMSKSKSDKVFLFANGLNIQSGHLIQSLLSDFNVPITVNSTYGWYVNFWYTYSTKILKISENVGNSFVYLVVALE